MLKSQGGWKKVWESREGISHQTGFSFFQWGAHQVLQDVALRSHDCYWLAETVGILMEKSKEVWIWETSERMKSKGKITWILNAWQVFFLLGGLLFFIFTPAVLQQEEKRWEWESLPHPGWSAQWIYWNLPIRFCLPWMDRWLVKGGKVCWDLSGGWGGGGGFKGWRLRATG